MRAARAVFLAAFLAAPAAHAQGDLAAAAQNPVAAMYSLPFQNNTLFGVGPGGNDTANVLNIQPVIPFTAGSWNIVNRTIAPVIYLPSLTGGLPDLGDGSLSHSQFGLGDINHSVYLSPADSGAWIWGLGLSLTLPTATSSTLGSGRWSAGPAAVVLTQPKPWTIGLLFRQLWDFAGDDNRNHVNQTLLQPFVNYNLADGWYLVSSPVITANWEASSGNRWTIPVGGGVGKIFRLGSQPMNAQIQVFDYLDSPRYGPDWAVRFQLQFLFPR